MANKPILLWPQRRISRSARSTLAYTFDRQVMGAVIQSRVHYSFADCLLHENQLVIRRENSDPVYRGEVRPDESCAAILGSVSDSDLSELLDTDLESESDGSDELSSPNLPSSPDPLPGSSPASTRESTPAAEHLSSPHTPYRRIVTYASRDRHRFEQGNTQSEAQVTPRRSSRLRAAAEPTPPAFSADPDHGIFTTEQLRNDGCGVYPWINDKPRPLIDRHTFIMAVVAGAPKNNGLWWEHIHRGAVKALNRVFRDFDFKEVEGDHHIRFGITFGEEYAAPHGIGHLVPNLRYITLLENNEALNAISGYQNHLYQHFAGQGHASVRAKVDELISREIVFPAYQHSVFTTTEISLGNAPSPAHKNVGTAFNTMEVITVLGSWDSRKGGGIMFWDDNTVIELVPGASVLFPAGTKHYSLVAVAPHETRYVFRQYCHAGVLRWVEKGGRSDVEFEVGARQDEVEAWNEIRAKRGHASARMFSKIGDIFVI